MIYRLTLGVVLDGPAPHDLDGRLAELRGVTSVEATSDRVTVTLTAEAATPADALASTAKRTLEAMSLADGRCGQIASAEVFTEAEADRRVAEDGLPEVVGIAEIADLLNVSRQRASALQTRNGFPQPVAQLRTGPVWRLNDLSKFAGTWDGQPGRPSETSTVVPVPVDVGQLVRTVAKFIPNPVARNAVKIVRWYATRPKG